MAHSKLSKTCVWPSAMISMDLSYSFPQTSQLDMIGSPSKGFEAWATSLIGLQISHRRGPLIELISLPGAPVAAPSCCTVQASESIGPPHSTASAHLTYKECHHA